MRAGFALAMLAFALTACSATTVTRRRIANWYVEHSTECDPSDVTVVQRTRRLWEASGCSQPETYHGYCRQSGSCRYVPESRVMRRAAFDLRCDASALERRTLAYGQVGVSGCGNRAVYVLTNTGWVLNGAVVRTN